MTRKNANKENVVSFWVSITKLRNYQFDDHGGLISR